jgi:two-component system sensor kinase FixL
MIQELNLIVGFILALVMLVPTMYMWQKIQRRLAEYGKRDAETGLENINLGETTDKTMPQPPFPQPYLSEQTVPDQVRNESSTSGNTPQAPLKKADSQQIDQLEYHKEQTEQFRAIFESTPACVQLQNNNFIVERLNQAGLLLFETSLPSNIIGHSIYDFIVKQYHPAYKKMNEAVFNGEQSCLEYEILTFPGNRRWMRTVAVPLRNTQQKVTHLIAITHDITENRRLSQLHEAHRNQLQTIIESEPECVKLQDASGVIMEMNPAGLSLLDAKNNEDVIGKVIYDFIAAEYKDEYRDLTARVFGGGRGCMEFEVFSMDGQRRWLETHAAPLFDNAGEVTALLAITRDIDGRKKNEARLREQQTELAHVCRLSTMGEMASSLAHELNQPLCAVSSYAESARLLNQSENIELDKLLEKIVHQSLRATQIIQNVRDFVRKQAPAPKSISAESVINSVIEFIEPDRQRGMVQIKLKIAPNISPIKADRVQVEQVLLNLLNNAIQALRKLDTEERIISIEVLQEAREDILFKVSNAGPAIKQAIAAELFTPFFTTKDAGLGMGLSISRSIIEAHGGRIWYVSEADDGSCFCFTLPTVDDD